MLFKGSRIYKYLHHQNSSFKYSSMNQGTKKSFKFASIQLKVGSDKSLNLKSATEKIKEASLNGAQVVALPVSNIYITCMIQSYFNQISFFNERNVLIVLMEIHIFLNTVKKYQERLIQLFLKLH